MGRRALKIDETSLACSHVFEVLRNKRQITMYRIKKDLTISNGRVDRLFKGEAVWTMDDFAAFCMYFKVSPSTMLGHILKEKENSSTPVTPLSVLKSNVPRVPKEVVDTSRMVAQKSKKRPGTETDEGFDSA